MRPSATAEDTTAPSDPIKIIATCLLFISTSATISPDTDEVVPAAALTPVPAERDGLLRPRR